MGVLVGCKSIETAEPTEAPTETQAPTDKPTEKPTEKPTDNNGNKDDNKTEENETVQTNWNDDGSLKILAIGNSFSDDTTKYLYDIAKAAGVENVSLGNLFIGGCSLNTHATNAKGNKAAYDYRTNTDGEWKTTPNYKMGDAIKSQKWDFISLQQASGSSGIADTYVELEYLIGYVKSLCPDAKIIWNMTWAYQQDSTHKDFAKYDGNQLNMYRSIVTAVEDVVIYRAKIETVVPNGTAIQNARTSYIGDKLTRDGFHLSLDLGRYIAGLTFFSKLTGISIENISYAPAGVDDGMKQVAIESVMNALETPFSITNSKLTEKPAPDYSGYDVLDMGWTASSYWHSTQDQNMRNGSDNTSRKFFASRKFTKDEIPVGSIIVVAEGWQYRPEAWQNSTDKLTGTRPANVSVSTVTVTESWWADYNYRAFNLSKTDGSFIDGLSVNEVTPALIIYVPKN